MELDKRLARLVDEQEIVSLSWRYGSLIDDGDIAGWLALFTGDAYLSYQGGAAEATGQAALEAFVGQALAQSGDRPTTHLVANVKVDLDEDDPDHATGRTTGLVCFFDDEEQLVTRGITYRDNFRRSAAGWRISVRQHDMQWEHRAAPTFGPASGASNG